MRCYERFRVGLMAGLLAVGMSATFAPSAHAGAIFGKSFDLPQIVPFFGAEYVRAGSLSLNSALLGSVEGTGFTWGALGGVRLGPINLGLLYQRTTVEPQPMVDVKFNKLYGEFGVYSLWGPVGFLMHLDFGYSWVGGSLANNVIGDTVRGLGGKIGLAVDYYIVPLLSVGFGAAFDAVGYFEQNDLVGAYGGTFVGRIGLHI